MIRKMIKTCILIRPVKINGAYRKINTANRIITGMAKAARLMRVVVFMFEFYMFFSNWEKG